MLIKFGFSQMAALVLSLFFFSCGGGGGTNPTPTATAPRITTQPQSQTVNLGSTATFTVAVTGTPAPTLQWQKNYVDVAGATSTTIHLINVQAADDLAQITCIATNTAGTATSNSATLTVITTPTITIKPANQNVFAGDTATFSVVASGSSLNYQWMKDGANISDATKNIYTTPAVTYADNGAAFSVVVSNSAGSVTSSNAMLTVYPPCPGGIVGNPALPPTVTLNTPAAGASQLSGHANNIDASKIRVVIYVLTNMWWIQPWDSAPYTDICSDGSWTSYTHPWGRIVVLLVDPSSFKASPTLITHPSLESGVLTWTEYPSSGPPSLIFSGYTWGIKVSSDPFDPGPNYWSNDPSVVHVGAGGLYLKIININNQWQCGEVYLLQSLGYGTYTVQISCQLDQLDLNTIAAPLFTYAVPGQELDFEYSGMNGLIPAPNNSQFVVQPWDVSGNIYRYVQPAVAQFTSQFEWRSDHVKFRTWEGWATVPTVSDIIQEWNYTGAYIPPPGQERVHINLWLLNGLAPENGVGDEMIIKSFTFMP